MDADKLTLASREERMGIAAAAVQQAKDGASSWFKSLPVVGNILDAPPPPGPLSALDSLEMAMMPMLDALNHRSGSQVTSVSQPCHSQVTAMPQPCNALNHRSGSQVRRCATDATSATPLG